jgi:gluconolactonase
VTSTRATRPKGRLDSSSRWCRPLVDGIRHTEGIAWDPRGHLYTGTDSGDLLRYGPSDALPERVAAVGGRVLGVAIDGNGRVYCCDQTNRCLWRYSPGSGAPVKISEGGPSRRMTCPNGLVFADDGTLYVGDSGSWDEGGAAIFGIRGGNTWVVPGTDSVDYINGLAIDPAGSHLYAIASRLPGVIRFPFGAKGHVGASEVFWMAPRGSIPDGLAFTSQGAMVVAFFEPNQILLVSDGEVVELAADERDGVLAGPTNVAFFGETLERLATTNIRDDHLSEVMLRSSMQIAGSPLRYPSL